VKRTRLIAAPLGAAAVLLLLANPASASEETVGSCLVETIEHGGIESFEHTVEAGHAEGADEEAEAALAELEEDLEGCLEAPSPIIPELNEIIWGGLAFLVLLVAMVRWGFPLVRSTMEARTDKIRGDLEAADTERAEAAKVREQHEAELAATRADVNRIIDEARQEAAGVRSDLQAKAEADIVEMRRRADADVAAARQRALTDLQGEVNEIVVGAAERVVEHNLDPETQRELINNYITSVGSR